MAKMTGPAVAGVGGSSIFERVQARLIEMENRKREIALHKTAKEEFFVFQLGGIRFAAEFAYVGTSASKFFFTPLFHMPEQLAGIFSYEGGVHTLFHLDLLMGLPPSQPKLLVVFESHELKIGVLVDEIESPVELDLAARINAIGEGEEAPPFVDGYLPFAGERIFHLDVEALLKSEKVWI